MSTVLTLTTYFAERQRSGDRFLADAVLDLIERRRVGSSVMLRGIASFGPTQVIRSDRSLSLSEDPPVTITAVDTADRITALADEVATLIGRGVITLQRGFAAPDVKLILPRHSDAKLVLSAGRAQYGPLLESGVQIYERREVMLHAKTAVIDGVWSTVGSANLDWRSFVHNLPDGYESLINEEGDNVSAGQKQLLTIARAFLSDPAILILDEATSSVDTRTEVQIQEAMNALRKDRTSFVIAHRLSTIRGADLIVVMENGRIVEQGTHHELLSRDGPYFRLYNSQFAGAAIDEAALHSALDSLHGLPSPGTSASKVSTRPVGSGVRLGLWCCALAQTKSVRRSGPPR